MDGIPIDALDEPYYFRNRKPMNQAEFDDTYNLTRKPPSKFNVKRRSWKIAKRYVSPFMSITNFRKFIFDLIPILKWLPEYDWKSNFLSDLIGGLTVGIMHVPQGIAYAVIAKQDPIVGLYTSLFPGFFYLFFATSRHASLGTFAVVALMTGLAVERESVLSLDSLEQNRTSDVDLPSRLEVSCALVFMVGVIQFIMALFNLQFLTTYMSDELITGFSTGAAMHVLVAQFKQFFGMTTLKKHSGPGYIIQTVIDVILNLPNANIVTTIIGIATMIFVYIGKEYLNPMFKKKTKTKIPIPFELIAVIIFTIIMSVTNWHREFNVRVVEHIPTGFPDITIPRFDVMDNILPDAISISVVAVAVHLSLSKMFAKKLAYEIDCGQELYALSISSVASSFFPTFPASCAVGRTIVGVETGIISQIATVVAAGFVFLVSLYFGRFLEALPMCVLSAIILVAVKGMVYKFKELPRLWRLSKPDFLVWIVACLATVLIDVTEGLVVGVVFALLSTIVREQYPKWRILANLSDSSDFFDDDRYQKVVYYKGICIFRFDAPLLFYNVECFKKYVEKAYNEWKRSHEFFVTKHDEKLSTKTLSEFAPLENVLSRHLIIDCSGFTLIDLMGVNAIKEVFSDMRKQNVLVYFANVRPNILGVLERCEIFDIVAKSNFYPTIRDATEIAKQRQKELGITNMAYVKEDNDWREIYSVTDL
ncbi:unnamed protein product [Caenorhabditis bovis]|uniref:STAS domain-containing protein n=1 Tax=Caenorhabditis bovis TaxID=2654633 RepID=A0A8S1EF03_9PELO|nr:unnamed protein product [Caenorhabditis bovis]